MFKKVPFLFLGILLIFGTTSPTYLSRAQSQSPLALQSVQARNFETTKEIAFASVVTVLQDAGYIIDSADLFSGFVTGTSPTRAAGAKKKAKRKKTYTKVTVFLEQLNDETTRIRLNFVSIYEKYNLSSEHLRSDTPIVDPLIYQNTFEEISKAIFMRESFR